jgi:hypothetical protein
MGTASPLRALEVINTISAGGAELHLLTLCRGLRTRGVDVQVAYLKRAPSETRSLEQEFEKEGIPLTDLGADVQYRTGIVKARKLARSFGN